MENKKYIIEIILVSLFIIQVSIVTFTYWYKEIRKDKTVKQRKIMSNNKQSTVRYIIVDIVNKKFFLDADGNVKFFDSYDNAVLHCNIYELSNTWICHLLYNYQEK